MTFTSYTVMRYEKKAWKHADFIVVELFFLVCYGRCARRRRPVSLFAFFLVGDL